MDVENLECQLAQAQIVRFLAGDPLPEDTVAELEKHLAECESCKAAAQQRKESLQRMLGEPAEAEPKKAKAKVQGKRKAKGANNVEDAELHQFAPEPEMVEDPSLIPDIDQFATKLDAAIGKKSESDVLDKNEIQALFEAASAAPAAAPVVDPLESVPDDAMLRADDIVDMFASQSAPEPAAVKAIPDDAMLGSDDIAALFAQASEPTATPPAPVSIKVDSEAISDNQVLGADDIAALFTSSETVAEPEVPEFMAPSDTLEAEPEVNPLSVYELLDIEVPEEPVEVAATEEQQSEEQEKELAAVAVLAHESAHEEEEGEKKKPSVKIVIEGFPQIFGKNLKTIAYSASLGIVLIAMTAFSKNPSKMLGDKVLKEGEKVAVAQKDETTEEEETTTDDHSEKPDKSDHSDKSDQSDQSDQSEKVDHTTEPEKTEHSKPDPDHETTPEPKPEPKKATTPKAPPPVSVEDEYLVARPSSAKTAGPRTAPRKTTTRRKPATVVRQPQPQVSKRKTTTKRPASKPAAQPKAKSGSSVKVYDENGRPLN